MEDKKNWKGRRNVLNCKLTFLRQKGHRSLEDYCLNILLVIFLSRWGSECRFLAVTNVMFVESKLSPSAPHLHTAWHGQVLSLFSLVVFYSLFICLALCFFFVCFFLTDPPAGKQAIVFLWPASVFNSVWVCLSPVHFSSRSKCGLWYYIFVCMCLCLWRCYLCSDKTVNQINLAWKSLSAGPLCVHVSVFLCVCVFECFPPSQPAHRVSHWLLYCVYAFVCLLVSVCVKEIYRECYISEWVCRVQR